MDLKAKDAELLALEQELNRDIDRKLAEKGDDLLWPKACNYIIPNEFGERFGFYGSKPLFGKYLATFYGLQHTDITVWTSAYGFLTYFMPMFGAALSDSYLGKFWTIVDLSIVYGTGTLLLAVLSVPGIAGYGASYLSADAVAAAITAGDPLPGPYADNRVLPFWTFFLPMLLMAIGAGGIKPCVSAHGGDQYLPNQRKGLDFFFSVFYVAINAGALISGNSTPYMRKYLVCWGASCYFSAYMMCSGVFIVSMLIFIIGHNSYRIVPPRGVFLPWISLKITVLGFIRSCTSSRKDTALVTDKDHKSSFLDWSIPEYGVELVNETRLLGNMVALLLPLIFFWGVYDQGQNEWQFQYNMMTPTGIPVEAFGNMNSIFVLLMVPALVPFYRLLENMGIRFTILHRMGVGFSLMTISYGISWVLQPMIIAGFQPGITTTIIANEHVCTDPERCLSAWWLVPQWFLLSLGESFISPEGLKLTYMNVGPMMKSQSLALFLLMSGLGSLFTLIVTKITEHWTSYNDATSFRALGSPDGGISMPAKFGFFFATCLVANIWFILWAKYIFTFRDEAASMTTVKRKIKNAE